MWVVATHARTHAREREWPEVNGSNPGSVEETVPRKTRLTTTDTYSIFRFPNGCFQFVDSMRSLTTLNGIVLIQLKPPSELLEGTLNLPADFIAEVWNSCVQILHT